MSMLREIAIRSIGSAQVQAARERRGVTVTRPDSIGDHLENGFIRGLSFVSPESGMDFAKGKTTWPGFGSAAFSAATKVPLIVFVPPALELNPIEAVGFDIAASLGINLIEGAAILGIRKLLQSRRGLHAEKYPKVSA